MSDTAPLLPPVTERPTWFESVRDRVVAHPQLSRVMRWLAPTLVTVLAAALRLQNLQHPHELMFDETYYVKDSWSLWTQGYEGEWRDGADERFADGDTSSLKTTGSYVVHPPLGKWLIALGMALFGVDSSFGWRAATAVFGTLTVLVVYFLALELTRSRVTAMIASGLLAVDGLGIVLSRVGLLDGILAFFITVAVLCVVYDRRDRPVHRDGAHWGAVRWNRPWLFTAGVLLGAATAVKWSGLYALAGLGIYVVVTDALARRRAGIAYWPMDAVIRQGPISFLLLVPIALVTYIASWTGWLLTSGGYDRDAAANPLVALWKYHESIYSFHIGLSSGHPYASAAWQWPFLLRPTAIWVGNDQGGCATDHCISVISSVPNPLIWYGGMIAAIYLLSRVIRALMARTSVSPAVSIPLVGLAVTYLPWLLYPERTVFQFYTVVMAPFVVLALAVALRAIAGTRRDPLSRRQAGQLTVVVVLVVVAAVSAFFYPVWTGMSVPYEFWLVHNWLPGWI